MRSAPQTVPALDLTDPANFLHRIDLSGNVGRFVRIRREQLYASFLDDRAGFTDEEAALPLDRLKVRKADAAGPPRIIFHVGFCGSTHLARLIECSNTALSLREPQALTDLAIYQSALGQAGLADRHLRDLTTRVLGLLSRRWHPGTPVVIKPSNWCNNLLATLSMQDMRPLFLISSQRSFLLAILRGGQERLAFAARAAVHFGNGSTDVAEWVARALSQQASDLERIVRLAGIVHAAQIRMFQAAGAAMPNRRPRTIDFAALTDAPVETTREAAATLELDPPKADDIRRVLQRDAKNDALAFDAEARPRIDRDLERLHNLMLDRVQDWIRRTQPSP